MKLSVVALKCLHASPPAQKSLVWFLLQCAILCVSSTINSRILTTQRPGLCITCCPGHALHLTPILSFRYGQTRWGAPQFKRLSGRAGKKKNSLTPFSSLHVSWRLEFLFLSHWMLLHWQVNGSVRQLHHCRSTTNLSSGESAQKKLEGHSFTMLSEITVSKILHGHPWAFLSSWSWKCCSRNVYLKTSVSTGRQLIKSTFGRSLLVIIGDEWIKESCVMRIFNKNSVLFK